MVCALLGLLVACPRERITEEQRALWIDGEVAATVTEIARESRGGGVLVQRRLTLAAEPDDAVLVLASLDAQGFATSASFRREGNKGKRYTELARKHVDGGIGEKLVVFSRGDDETLLLPDAPVVLLDVLHRLKARPGQQVTLLDLEHAVPLPARIDATGQLLYADGTPVEPVVGGRVEVAAGATPPMPGRGPAPATPGPDDAVQPAHSSRAPFLEAKTQSVVTWCRGHAVGAGPLAAARALALAAKPRLAPERAGGPPSALAGVTVGGGDETGAALVVACLRALEHPARVVSGVVDGVVGDGTGPAQPRPWRTWAQVHDGTAWTDVDPLDIDVNGEQALPHRALVEGFRGPLTTGRLARAPVERITPPGSSL